MKTKGRPSGRSRAAGAGAANGSGADASPARQMHAILDMQGGGRSNKKSGSSTSRQQAESIPASVPAPNADFMAQMSSVMNWMSAVAAGGAAQPAQQQQQQPLQQPKPTRHAPHPARSPASSPSSSAPASRSQYVDSDSDAFSEGNETDIEEVSGAPIHREDPTGARNHSARVVVRIFRASHRTHFIVWLGLFVLLCRRRRVSLRANRSNRAPVPVWTRILIR